MGPKTSKPEDFAIEGRWPDGSYLARGPFFAAQAADDERRKLARKGCFSLEVIELVTPPVMRRKLMRRKRGAKGDK